jgi:glutamate synthase (NADPH/NADH) large chain
MPHALYHQSEHDACGVGAVVALSQVPRRDVVEKGLQALANLMHRGAVGADGKTGDGAGLRLELNPAFFHGLASRFGGFDPARHRLAVAMVFLPRKNLEEQEFCRTVMESEIAAAGLHALGWRQVPINTQMLGKKRRKTAQKLSSFFSPFPSKCRLIRRSGYSTPPGGGWKSVCWQRAIAIFISVLFPRAPLFIKA